jgi:ABC-type amino acid transport substrate-binding protein
MKRLGSLLFAIVLVVSIFTGCQSQSSEVTKLEDLKDQTIGTITWFGVTDEALLDIFSKGYSTEFKSVKSFESESSLIMALDASKIEAAWLRDFQATAYSKDSDKYSMFTSENDSKVAGSARMAAATDSIAANDIAKINAALEQLKVDGTLDTLKQAYIDDFSFSENYESITMPKFDAAPTYKVSISGSMVPLDYIAADGNPTGFSIALLSKISEVTKLNFELVTVGIGQDKLELASGKIDYIFCYTLTDESMKNEAALTFSDSYFSYSGAAFLVKK